MDLIAHPGILGNSLKLLRWPHKDGDLVCFPHLPERISRILILVRKSELVLHKIAVLSVSNLF